MSGCSRAHRKNASRKFASHTMRLANLRNGDALVGVPDGTAEEGGT